MKRRDGFTLLEICLVVAIIVMVTLIAEPSVSGLFAEERLRRSFDALDSLVRKAQARSVDERRAYMLAWKKDAIDLVPPYELGAEIAVSVGEDGLALGRG